MAQLGLMMMSAHERKAMTSGDGESNLAPDRSQLTDLQPRGGWASWRKGPTLLPGLVLYGPLPRDVCPGVKEAIGSFKDGWTLALN